MVYDGLGYGRDNERESFDPGLTQDEQAVLDHVSGLTGTLPEPSGDACEDREHVGELMAMRSRIGAMAINPPKMKLTFDDVLIAAKDAPQPTDKRIFYKLKGRWGFGVVSAIGVCLALIAGAISTGNLKTLFTGQDSPPVLNQTTSDTPHTLEKPAQNQQGVTETVTTAASDVTILTRQEPAAGLLDVASSGR